MEREIKFVAHAVKWFDKINGNTYHSVRIERVADGAILKSYPMVYGYGDHYRQTALDLMNDNNWIPERYKTPCKNGGTLNHLYEQENNYPISWNVYNGLQRDMKNNVK